MSLVDQSCTLQNVSVLAQQGQSYTCTLNQVDIEKNNNKFYILQLLTNGSKYYLWTRYGRVGDPGVKNFKEFGDAGSAIAAFTKQFRDKTGNTWGATFSKKPGKYMLLELEAPVLKPAAPATPMPPASSTPVVTVATVTPVVTVTPTTPTTPATPVAAASSTPLTSMASLLAAIPKPPTADATSESVSAVSPVAPTPAVPALVLPPKILSVIQKIGSHKLMTDTLIKLDLDVKRMPLGKISRNMIAHAHEILRTLSTSLGQLNSSEIMARSSEFWTMVPYATKRNVRPPVLDNVAAITQCSQLLDTLENIEIAGTILQRSSNEVEIYKSLGITLTYLDSGMEVDVIRQYVRSTHGSTHRYRLDLIDVYRVEKPSHDAADTQKLFDSTPNHRLLFHGSRMANFMGILAEGLRIPKPSQVSNGSTLGRGIYFADAVSKSYNYVCSSETDHTGFMVLCEVALGNPHVVYGCCDRDGVDQGQHSRWAKGNWSPDEAQFTNLGSVVVPCGSLIENPLARHSSFLYNEYVVYNTHQYRFRYLIYLRDAK
jgi:poly [ADP-ribose] polymerase